MIECGYYRAYFVLCCCFCLSEPKRQALANPVKGKNLIIRPSASSSSTSNGTTTQGTKITVNVLNANSSGGNEEEKKPVEAEKPKSKRVGRKNRRQSWTNVAMGTRVEALYRGRNKFISFGKITTHHVDGTFNIEFDCGEVATHVHGE